MGVVIFLVQIMVVVGGDDGAVGAFGDFEEFGDHGHLGGVEVVLEFDVEIFAEDVFVLECAGDGGVHVAAFEAGGDFGAEVAVDDDEAFVVFGEGFLVDAGAVVEAFGEGEGGEFEDVFPADFVFDDDGEVVGGFGDSVGVFVEAGVWCDVEFAADDGFDVVFFGGVVPVDGAEEVAVVGEGDGGHVELFGFLEEGVDGGAAVEEGEVGMAVEMDKGSGVVGHVWVSSVNVGSIPRGGGEGGVPRGGCQERCGSLAFSK